MTDAQKRVVDVGATLAKWGISGMGLAFTCGSKFAGATLGMATTLADQFSGCKMGMPIGKLGLDGMNWLGKTAVGGAVKLGHKGVDLLATKIKSRL
ncbi:MAG: hypothetical protein IJZ59_02320 [Alphaproteobacteria bacterium]|nr:hypothetical protein [Alphaproteobacteria bacterium]